MSTKFEQLLDYLVNEEHEKANELFHEIVVEKSREIYENLIAEEEDDQQDEAADEQDESVDEASEDDEQDESVDESVEEDEMDEGADEEADESLEVEDSYGMEADDDSSEFEPGDGTDELGAEISADGEEDGEEAEDKAIFDIKNAIQELEAAFAELEKAQGSEEPHGEFGADDSEIGADDEEGEDEMMGKPAFESRRITREYTETVGNDWEKNSQKTQGQIVGANTGEKMPGSNEGKSVVSSGKGKPTTGADAKNILGNSKDAGEGVNTGTTPNGKAGGLVGNVKGKFTGSGTHNVDGVKSGIKTVKKQGSGYPGNNKTAGPVGSGTGDKAGQTSVGQVKSPINGAPNRNA